MHVTKTNRENIPLRARLDARSRYGSRVAGVVVGFLALLYEFCAFAQFQSTSLVPLNSFSVANSAPAIATSEDGHHVVAAWSGQVGAKRRIVLREQYFGEWLPEMFVDEDPAFDNDSPQVAVDSFGTIYVAWIARTLASDVIMLRTNRAGQWSAPLCLSSVYDQPAIFDDLSMVLTNTFPPQIWLAWQASTGSSYTILAANVKQPGGTHTVWDVARPLSQAAYNICPQLFLAHATQSPTIVWYTTQESEFIPVKARYFPEEGNWDLEVMGNLPEVVFATRFPRLLMATEGLWTFWLEPTSEGDTARIHLLTDKVNTSTTSTTAFALTPLHRGERGTALTASLSYAGDGPVFSWIAELPLTPHETRTKLRLAVASHDPATGNVICHDGAINLPVQPSSIAIKPLGTKKLALLFAAESDYGGDGHIYYCEISQLR